MNYVHLTLNKNKERKATDLLQTQMRVFHVTIYKTHVHFNKLIMRVLQSHSEIYYELCRYITFYLRDNYVIAKTFSCSRIKEQGRMPFRLANCVFFNSSTLVRYWEQIAVGV